MYIMHNANAELILKKVMCLIKTIDFFCMNHYTSNYRNDIIQSYKKEEK